MPGQNLKGPSLITKMNKLRELALKFGKNSRNASSQMHSVKTVQKNDLLRRISECIEKNKINIFQGNMLDLKVAKKANKDSAFLDRLEITNKSIHDMCNGLEQVASLPDPIGTISNLMEQPSLSSLCARLLRP